ncbi:unnamed protein product [Microthlaspi erraticum]|uniref:Uncharacterized protein n=1 Tax=Microthlaspi erraticum TaxID=1685480 RepID=A0A6D2HMC0_9BRAS|nr:unnamed protein product [Microthlaspi erraticum]
MVYSKKLYILPCTLTKTASSLFHPCFAPISEWTSFTGAPLLNWNVASFFPDSDLAFDDLGSPPNGDISSVKLLSLFCFLFLLIGRAPSPVTESTGFVEFSRRTDLSPLFFNLPDQPAFGRRALLIQREHLYGDAETSTKTYRSTALLLTHGTKCEVAAYHSFKSHVSGDNPPPTALRSSDISGFPGASRRIVSSPPSTFDGDKISSAVVSVFNSMICASTTHGKPLYYSVSTFRSMESPSKFAHRRFQPPQQLSGVPSSERSIPSASSFMERSIPSAPCKRRRRSPMWKDSLASAEDHFNIIRTLVNVLSLGVCCVDPSLVIIERQQSIIVGLSTDYVDLDSGVVPTYRRIRIYIAPLMFGKSHQTLITSYFRLFVFDDRRTYPF